MEYTVTLFENFRCGIGYLECTIPGAEQALRCVVYYIILAAILQTYQNRCVKIGEEVLSERFESTST